MVKVIRWLLAFAVLAVSQSACSGAAVAPTRPVTVGPAPSAVVTLPTRMPVQVPSPALPAAPVASPPGGAVSSPGQALPTSAAVAATAAPPSVAVPPRAPTAGGTGTVVDRLTASAKSDLVGRLGVAAADITVVSATPQEWRDSSLGCPQPGGIYAQVITPGYRIVLGAGGREYEYHTDSAGRVVFCANP